MGAPFKERLNANLKQNGPMDMGAFIEAVNAHYYATRDPFGGQGDFITAPEISQTFGEMLAISLIDGWDITKAPRVHLVEIGAGRGTMMADMLGIFKMAGRLQAINIHVIENSPYLRQIQGQKLAGYDVRFHDDLGSLPDDAPLLMVANEFLDALPIRQAVLGDDGWQERVVVDGPEFGTRPLPHGFMPLFSAAHGAVYEFAPKRDFVVEQIATRIKAQGGAFLTLDYGFAHDTPTGDTLQAVYKHKPCGVFEHLGEADLSAHVNFSRIVAIGAIAGCDVYTPVSQGEFLQRLGIMMRAEQLAKAAGNIDAGAVHEGVMRLIDPKGMGQIFLAGGFASGGFGLFGFSEVAAQQ